ncbi:MAG: hypothetical protein IJT63_01655 [Lachnospiraceae bacterium]|nr:hypothetical protein [Lachnospiraceae bacterium]
MCIDEKRFRSLFHEKMKAEIAFRGLPEHFGIMARMRTDIFPRTCKGSGDGFTYEFSMGGTYKDLSYKIHSIAGKRAGKRYIKGAEKIGKVKEMMRNEEIFEKEAG